MNVINIDGIMYLAGNSEKLVSNYNILCGISLRSK